MPKQMGYQALLYYGPKGSTATTLLKCRVDANIEYVPETGSTTCAGDGTVPPTNTGKATAITPKISFNMVVDSDHSAAATFLAAAKTGLAIALKCESFDYDCVISAKQGMPLKGEQTIDIESVVIEERPEEDEETTTTAE